MEDPTLTLGDQPIELPYHDVMNAVARTLDQIFNGTEGARETGFVLIVFPFGEHDGRCNYISNAQRDDVMVMLREQLARFDGSPDITGQG